MLEEAEWLAKVTRQGPRVLTSESRFSCLVFIHSTNI